jgi:hypothetical protein
MVVLFVVLEMLELSSHPITFRAVSALTYVVNLFTYLFLTDMALCLFFA